MPKIEDFKNAFNNIPYQPDKVERVFMAKESLQSLNIPIFHIIPQEVTFLRLDIKNGELLHVEFYNTPLPPELIYEQVCDICQEVTTSYKAEKGSKICLKCHMKDMLNGQN